MKQLALLVAMLFVGCSLAAEIKPGLPAGARAGAAAITFNKHIAPIVFQNCASCHHAGEVAPFALMSYADVKDRAKTIAKVTQKRHMPPWKAEPGFGEFADPRRLTDAQIALIKQWSEQGAAEGNAADLPKPPKFVEGWQLGKPDMVLEMPEAYNVPAEGRDIYRCFVIPIANTEDKYVSAVEYRPGNRTVVHHALLFLDSNGMARKKDEADPAPGYGSVGGPGFIPSGALGGWAPGTFPKPLPDGVAAVIKKGSDLVIQTHFHPTGKAESEKSVVGIYFSKKPPQRVLLGGGLGSIKIDIAPGEKAYKVAETMTLPVDVEMIGITPHAHLLCKEIKATFTPPLGTKRPLIWIKDWDFNWQDQYQYKTPLRMPKGSKIEMEFSYDNSADNIHNPSTPPQRVRLGEQTTDEMAILFFNVVLANQADANKFLQAMIEQQVASGGKAIQDEIEKFKKMTPDDQAKTVKDFLEKFKNGQ